MFDTHTVAMIILVVVVPMLLLGLATLHDV